MCIRIYVFMRIHLYRDVCKLPILFIVQWEYGPITSTYLILLKQKLSGRPPIIILPPMCVKFMLYLCALLH